MQSDKCGNRTYSAPDSIEFDTFFSLNFEPQDINIFIRQRSNQHTNTKTNSGSAFAQVFSFISNLSRYPKLWRIIQLHRNIQHENLKNVKDQLKVMTRQTLIGSKNFDKNGNQPGDFCFIIAASAETNLKHHWRQSLVKFNLGACPFLVPPTRGETRMAPKIGEKMGLGSIIDSL